MTSPSWSTLCITEQSFRVLTEHNATGLVCVVTLEEFLMTIRFCPKMTLITWYSCEMQHLHIFILHVGWDSLDLVSKEMDWKRWSYHSATSFPCPKTTLFLLPGANKEGYLASELTINFPLFAGWIWNTHVYNYTPHCLKMRALN